MPTSFRSCGTRERSSAARTATAATDALDLGEAQAALRQQGTGRLQECPYSLPSRGVRVQHLREPVDARRSSVHAADLRPCPGIGIGGDTDRALHAGCRPVSTRHRQGQRCRYLSNPPVQLSETVPGFELPRFAPRCQSVSEYGNLTKLQHRRRSTGFRRLINVALADGPARHSALPVQHSTSLSRQFQFRWTVVKFVSNVRVNVRFLMLFQSKMSQLSPRRAANGARHRDAGAWTVHESCRVGEGGVFVQPDDAWKEIHVLHWPPPTTMRPSRAPSPPSTSAPRSAKWWRA